MNRFMKMGVVALFSVTNDSHVKGKWLEDVLRREVNGEWSGVECKCEYE